MRFTTILKAAAVPGVLAAALLGTSAAAFASTGPGNGQAGHMTGNQAISYNDPYFGGVKCNEVQHPQFDNVTCQFTGSNPSFTVGQPGQVGWNSDFGPGSIVSNGKPIVHNGQGVLTFTITGDATTGQVTGYTGQVTYNG